MKLYYSPLSTYSQKVLIALYEKGIPFTPEFVNLSDPQARAAYERINATGKVPFLQATVDWQVPESTSIIEYLEDRFPHTPSLIPKAGGEAARLVRFIDRMADLYYNDAVTELLFQQLGFRAKDDERAARARKHIAMTYAHWDRRLAAQPWLCGADFSMADCAAIPPMHYAQMVAPFAAHANVLAYWQRALERPSYMRVRAEFEPILQRMMAERQAA